MFINSPPSSTIIPTRVVRSVSGLRNVLCPPPCDVFCPPHVFCPPLCDVLCSPLCDVLSHILCDVPNGPSHIPCDVLCYIPRDVLNGLWHILCNILWWPIFATPQLYLAFFQSVLVAFHLFLATFKFLPTFYQFLVTRTVFQIFDLLLQFVLLSFPRQDNIPIRVNLWSNKTRQLDTSHHVLFGSRCHLARNELTTSQDQMH